MYISNVGVFVKDLAGARAFFEETFGATLAFEWNVPEKQYYSCILKLDEGALIELMTKPEVVDLPKDPNRTGLAHIAIRVDTREELDRIAESFRSKGYRILYGPGDDGGAGEMRAVTFEEIIVEVGYDPN